MNKQALGQYGENLAIEYLTKEGYSILETRFRTQHGEVDIIASSPSNILCFIEVKGRSTGAFGRPAEAVTHRKQQALIMAAQAYLQQLEQLPVCRFDVIEVYFKTEKIVHMISAFEVS